MFKASDIRVALRSHFPAPEWEIAFEVRNAAGFAASRSADAVAMNMWPSRGLAIHGIEIKVSRGDWRRELAKPGKAEAVAKYCDFWWIAAPRDVVPLDELPVAWGLLEVSDDGKIKARKQPKQTDAALVDRSFVAAFLRSHGAIAGDEARKMIRDAIEVERTSDRERNAREIKRQVDEKTRRFDAVLKLDETIKRICGSSDYFSHEDFVAAVRMVFESGVASTYYGLASVHREVEGLKAKLDKAMAIMPTPSEGQRKLDLGELPLKRVRAA